MEKPSRRSALQRLDRWHITNTNLTSLDAPVVTLSVNLSTLDEWLTPFVDASKSKMLPDDDPCFLGSGYDPPSMVKPAVKTLPDDDPHCRTMMTQWGEHCPKDVTNWGERHSHGIGTGRSSRRQHGSTMGRQAPLRISYGETTTQLRSGKLFPEKSTYLRMISRGVKRCRIHPRWRTRE